MTEDLNTEASESTGLPANEETKVENSADNKPSEEAQSEEAAPEQAAKEPTKYEKLQAEHNNYRKATEKGFSRKTAAAAQLNNKVQEQAARIAELESGNVKVAADEPKEEDFETLDDFVQAKANWSAEQRFKELKKEEKDKNAADNAQHEMAQLQKNFQEQEAKFRADVPDYDDVSQVFNEIIGSYDQSNPSLQSASSAMIGGDNVPAVGYYLGTHPEKIDEILSMPPHLAYREIVKLDIKMAGEGNAQQNKKPLAAPPSPIQGSGKGRKALHEQSPEDIVKWATS